MIYRCKNEDCPLSWIGTRLFPSVPICGEAAEARPEEALTGPGLDPSGHPGGGTEAEGEALRCFRRAAELADPWGSATWAGVWRDGVGTPADPRQAVWLYQQAAELTYPPAMCQPGAALPGRHRRSQTARPRSRLVPRAAERGFAGASFCWPAAMSGGWAWSRIRSRRFEVVPRRRLSGIPPARWSWAGITKFGLGVEADPLQAVRWYRAAAEQDDRTEPAVWAGAMNSASAFRRIRPKPSAGTTAPPAREYSRAMCNLAACYEEGRGTEPDPALAARLYEQASQRGSLRATVNLARCCTEGVGVPPDDVRAAQLYRSAAEQGDGTAQCNLGWCYKNGRGVEQDWAEAARWYREAAALGEATAQCNLGWCYENGKGVEQDWPEAARWYRKAADQEDSAAQCNLAWCYENGAGLGRIWPRPPAGTAAPPGWAASGA